MDITLGFLLADREMDYALAQVRDAPGIVLRALPTGTGSPLVDVFQQPDPTRSPKLLFRILPPNKDDIRTVFVPNVVEPDRCFWLSSFFSVLAIWMVSSGEEAEVLANNTSWASEARIVAERNAAPYAIQSFRPEWRSNVTATFAPDSFMESAEEAEAQAGDSRHQSVVKNDGMGFDITTFDPTARDDDNEDGSEDAATPESSGSRLRPNAARLIACLVPVGEPATFAPREVHGVITSALAQIRAAHDTEALLHSIERGGLD